MKVKKYLAGLLPWVSKKDGLLLDRKLVSFNVHAVKDVYKQSVKTIINSISKPEFV